MWISHVITHQVVPFVCTLLYLRFACNIPERGAVCLPKSKRFDSSYSDSETVQTRFGKRFQTPRVAKARNSLRSTVDGILPSRRTRGIYLESMAGIGIPDLGFDDKQVVLCNHYHAAYLDEHCDGSCLSLFDYIGRRSSGKS